MLICIGDEIRDSLIEGKLYARHQELDVVDIQDVPLLNLPYRGQLPLDAVPLHLHPLHPGGTPPHEIQVLALPGAQLQGQGGPTHQQVGGDAVQAGDRFKHLGGMGGKASHEKRRLRRRVAIDLR